MNVLRAVQMFPPQVTAALEHLQQNSLTNSALLAFKDATSMINFMKVMKKWFDIHDTTYKGIDCRMPIFSENDDRLLWLQNEFCNNVKAIQDFHHNWCWQLHITPYFLALSLQWR